MGSEQGKRTRAAGRVIQEAQDAHESGELPDHLVLGFRLVATALAMKDSHRPGAMKIAGDYCEAVGLDRDRMEEQVSSRMYEAIQIEDMEKGLSDEDQ